MERYTTSSTDRFETSNLKENEFAWIDDGRIGVFDGQSLRQFPLGNSNNSIPSINTESVSLGQSVRLSRGKVDQFSDVGAAINHYIQEFGGGGRFGYIEVVGNYTLETQIDPRLADWIHLDCTGAKLTAADSLDGNMLGRNESDADIKHWRVAGGVWDCAGSTRSGIPGTAIRFYPDSSHTVEDVKVVDATALNTRNSGIVVVGTDCRIDSCVSKGFGAHGMIIGGDDSSIVNSVARDGVDYGIRDWIIGMTTLHGDDLVISNCRVDGLPDTSNKVNPQGYTLEDGQNQQLVDSVATDIGGTNNGYGKGVLLVGGSNGLSCRLENVTIGPVGNYAVSDGTPSNRPQPDGVAIDGLEAANQVRAEDWNNVDIVDVDCPFVRVLASRYNIENIRVRDCNARVELSQSNDDGNGPCDLTNVSIKECDIVTDGVAIRTTGSQSSWSAIAIEDNEIRLTGTSSRGISVTLPGGCSISGNRVEYPGGGSSDVRGIQADSGGYLEVCNNTVVKTPGPGIYIGSATGGRVSENTISEANQQGGGSTQYGAALVLTTCSDVRATDNDFVGTSQVSEIYENSDCAGTILEGNDIRTNGWSLNSGDAYPANNPGHSGLGTPPSSPWVGARYQDDGTNTGSVPLVARWDGGQWVATDNTTFN